MFNSQCINRSHNITLVFSCLFKSTLRLYSPILLKKKWYQSTCTEDKYTCSTWVFFPTTPEISGFAGHKNGVHVSRQPAIYFN